MIAMADWMQTFHIETARCQDFRDILQFIQFRTGSVRWAECPSGNGRDFEVRAQPPAMIELMKRADWSDDLKKIKAMWLREAVS